MNTPLEFDTLHAGAITVHLVEAGADNYIYVVAWGGECLVVDPAAAGPVARVIEANGLIPRAILATHRHGDHVAGIPELKSRYGCPVTGPAGAGIRGVDQEVAEGDTVPVGPLTFRVLGTPGHTATDISYYGADCGLLFCGDTLFSGGCGRLFECGPEVMWRSLQRLAQLPDETRVFCGHEYTESNLRFAVSVLPEKVLQEKLAAVQGLRAGGNPTLPTTIGEEKRINLFMRAEEPAIQAAVGMAGASGERVFAELRARKDRF